MCRTSACRRAVPQSPADAGCCLGACVCSRQPADFSSVRFVTHFRFLSRTMQVAACSKTLPQELRVSTDEASAPAAQAFAGGWFHTGDQGFLDVEGFLTLTGRIKELINRGGEKISPLEVATARLAQGPALINGHGHVNGFSIGAICRDCT